MALTKIGTDGVKDDAITSGKIPANAVGSSELADNAVDTAAIQDDAVTGDKIAAGTITNSNIQNGTIGTSKIGIGNITTDKIAAGNVTTAKIADQAVTLAKLEHGTSSNDGKFLRANNGADPSFETVSIPAGTTINNNANNRIITGSGTANTLEGESNLTWDGSLFKVNTGGTGDCFRVGTDSGADTALRIGSTGTNVDTHGVIKYDIDDNYFSFLIAGESHGSGGVYIENGGKVRLPAGVKLGGSADANLLNDYEEGTWTPSGTSASFQTAVGTYTKVGRCVTALFRVRIAASEGANYLQINGLPFDNEGGDTGEAIGSVSFTTSDQSGNMHCAVTTGTSILFYYGTGTPLRYNSTGVPNSHIRGGVVYYTAA